MDRLTQLLNMACLGGFGYLVYILWFLELNVEPTPFWTLATGEAESDKTTGMAMFFVGIFVAILAIFVAYFFIKLAYNFFVDFLAKIFPEDLHPLVNSIILLAVLGFCFLGKETVKMTALKVDCQINEVFSLGKPLSSESESK